MYCMGGYLHFKKLKSMNIMLNECDHAQSAEVSEIFAKVFPCCTTRISLLVYMYMHCDFKCYIYIAF